VGTSIIDIFAIDQQIVAHWVCEAMKANQATRRNGPASAWSFALFVLQ
jgi:hypothetical protein